MSAVLSVSRQQLPAGPWSTLGSPGRRVGGGSAHGCLSVSPKGCGLGLTLGLRSKVLRRAPVSQPLHQR